jgi:transcriptional regulator with XRE-family HTH domain
MLMANMLKAARALLGIRQSELAKAAGISLATLNNFERGIGDPRASTIDAIERSLWRAGITFMDDGESKGVSLRKLHRPNAFDTYNASRQVLEALDRTSLLNIQSVIFYRNSEITKEGEHKHYVALLLNGLTRAIIFDQARLSLETSSHAAEVAGIMLAAFAMYRDEIYYLPEFVLDSLRIPVPQAIDLIGETEFKKLDDPATFFELFGLTPDRIVPWLERGDHPLHQLFDLTQSRLRQPSEALELQ